MFSLLRRSRTTDLRILEVAPGKHVEWIDDEAVVLDVASGELHYLNPPAALAYGLFLEYGVESGLKNLFRTRDVRWRQRKEVRKLLDDMLVRGLLQQNDR